MKRSILALLAGAVLATSAHADIVVEERSEGFYAVKIINTITESDYDSLVEMVMSKPDGRFGYVLDSRGGDVGTALKIGRFLRKRKATVFVIRDQICYSACIFVLAGATSRMMTSGKIGIHRPYEPNDKTTSAAVQKTKYKKLGRLVKAYLSEMNVKPQLYDDMLYISPHEVRLLSEKELEGYGLTSKDPFEAEADLAREAKKLGISNQELIKRKARISARIDDECISKFKIAKDIGADVSYESPAWDKSIQCSDDIRNEIMYP